MCAERPNRRIPLSEPQLGGNEWAYVKECLDTNWVSSSGPFVDRFETEFAAYLRAPHAVAVINGTAALHAALRLAGVEIDDEVLVSTLTFIAPANAIRYLGAKPVFVDAEPKSWQMDANLVADFVTRDCRFEGGRLINLASGRRVKALLPVHILGHPVDMAPLLEIARAYDLAVIEDAAESLGALYRGRPVGTLGTLGCFSFNGNKTITTGGGGMIVTADSILGKRARYLVTQAKDDPLRYIHKEIGYNYRLSNVAAAIGTAQLERLAEAVAAKRHIAARYAQAWRELPGLSALEEASWASSAFWLSAILLEPSQFGLDRDALMSALQGAGIEVRPLWQPLHLSEAHAGAQALGGEVAEDIWARVVTLPSSAGLSSEDQDSVIRAVSEACRGRSKEGGKAS